MINRLFILDAGFPTSDIFRRTPPLSELIGNHDPSFTRGVGGVGIGSPLEGGISYGRNVSNTVDRNPDPEAECLCNVMPKRVIFNDPTATIVYWTDGTKTVVKCAKEDTYNALTGYALCYMKKTLGENAYRHILKSVYALECLTKAKKAKTGKTEKPAKASEEPTEKPAKKETKKPAEKQAKKTAKKTAGEKSR